jgi:hypothetical protein
MPRRKPTQEETDQALSANTEMPTAEIEAPETSEVTEAAPKATVIKGERLTGQALLDFVLANRERPVNELAFEAGYYTKKIDPETGEEKITYQKPAFHEAINRANGIDLAPATRTYAPRKNRAPVVKLGKNGNIVVGGRHSGVAGFEPGSKVKVESEPGRITIVAWADEDDDASDTDDQMDL